jgi:hypothetical protein
MRCGGAGLETGGTDAQVATVPLRTVFSSISEITIIPHCRSRALLIFLTGLDLDLSRSAQQRKNTGWGIIASIR